jgi:hypothetical protein
LSGGGVVAGGFEAFGFGFFFFVVGFMDLHLHRWGLGARQHGFVAGGGGGWCAAVTAHGVNYHIKKCHFCK